MLSLSLPVVASAALPAALAAAGILHDVYTGVAMFAGVLSLYVMASLWFRYSVRDAKGNLAPRWDLFNVTNTLALVLFATSVAYMLQFMLAHGRDHALMYFVAQPDVLLASCTALVTLCYMTAFFGVAWVYEDLSAGPSPIRLVPATTHATDVGFDTDVVVVGAGTAGTALALRLAKDGRKVTVVERSWTIPHRIVGELMQPGGIRALEDMGLDEAAKTSAIDPIQVDGYVCFTPGADRSRDLVLPYPTHDPASIAEFAGLQGLPVGEPSRGPVSSGFDPRPGTPAQHPRGRSFHNHRFVQALRDMAKQHPNITMHEGRVTALLSPQDVPASHPAAKLGGGNAETAVGVKWVDAEKNSHTVTAPLTVVADGAHSALRKRVLTEPKVTASSFFVGLALHHEEGSCPLPYPRTSPASGNTCREWI
ncbi:SQE2 [Symbiodinium sp. KB8]|nr:SQE2 [Symbiodinium sp. KB8]